MRGRRQPEQLGELYDDQPGGACQFTYHDGASTSAAPDHRATSFTRTPFHAATAAETTSYAAGTNRAQTVQHGSDSLIITYDGLGRRTSDYLATQPVASRRDYTYLPDGHLRTVSSAGGTVTLTYGIDGELSTIDGLGDHRALVYDDAGRLVAATVGVGTAAVEWEYHYLGDTPIATTRRSAGSAPQRLGFLHDRRGLIERVIDTKGSSY